MSGEPEGTNHVEQLAFAWAERDPLESWVLAAPDARPISPAVVVERPGTDEWTVEFDDGEQAWRSHNEIRPRHVLGATYSKRVQ